MYFENRVIAWSPDSQQIAFVGNNQEQFGLFALSIEDKSVRYIIPPLAPSIGEAGSDDPAMVLTAQERGASPYRERYDLSWSDTGILFSPVNTCICVQLLTPQGDVLEAWPLGSEFLASISGPYVVARDAYMLSEPPILVDVAHPAEVSLDLPDNARPMAWMDGTLYYATRTDVEVEIGYPDLQTGVAFEDRWMWGFIAESATLTLWRYDPRGTDNLVFQTVGYNFGVVRPTANNRLLVSVVTSNLDGIAAVNRGAAPEEVQDLLARPVTYVLDGDEVVFTLDGGQPDSSSGSFTVVMPG
jgi:hypothetical protein